MPDDLPPDAVEAMAKEWFSIDESRYSGDADWPEWDSDENAEARESYRVDATAALLAAQPAWEAWLREKVAQEIEASVAVTDHPDGSFSGTIYHAQYTHGIEDAARICREGGTP